MLGSALQTVHTVRIGTQSADQKRVINTRVRRQNHADAINETTGESVLRGLVRVAKDRKDTLENVGAVATVHAPQGCNREDVALRALP